MPAAGALGSFTKKRRGRGVIMDSGYQGGRGAYSSSGSRLTLVTATALRERGRYTQEIVTRFEGMNPNALFHLSSGGENGGTSWFLRGTE